MVHVWSCGEKNDLSKSTIKRKQFLYNNDELMIIDDVIIIMIMMMILRVMLDDDDNDDNFDGDELSCIIVMY